MAEKTDMVQQSDFDAKSFWQNKGFKNTTSYTLAEELIGTQDDFRNKTYQQIQMSDAQVRAVSSASSTDLQTLIETCLGRANMGMEAHHSDKQIIRRGGRKAAFFASKFFKYVEAYSGIIEVMKAADQQFGGLAYGCLSLLFIVAVNKEKQEDAIDNALLTLQQEFSIMAKLKEIHPTRNVSEYIAKAFYLGIRFCRDATIYYTQSSWRRLLYVIGRPPIVDLNVRLSEIAGAMAQLEKECVFLDRKRLQRIDNDVQTLKVDVRLIQAEIEDIRDQEDIKSADKLVRLLDRAGLPIDLMAQNPLETLQEYHSELQQGFEGLRRWEPFDMSLLETKAEYRKWKSDKRSSILLVYGKTRAHKADFSWLSPSIPSLVKESASNERPCAYHCCHSKHMEQDIPINPVFASLIVQLIRQNRGLGRERARFNELQDTIEEILRQPNKTALYLRLLKTLLRASENCLLLLDRVDRVKGRMKHWLTELCTLMEDPAVRVKIFLVADLRGGVEPNQKLEPALFEWMDEDYGEQFRAIQLDNDS